MMSPGRFQTYQIKELKKSSKLSIKQMNSGCKNPPLAGESSIMFDLSGPLLVLEINDGNDLKGQAA